METHGMSQSHYLTHPNGQVTHCVVDDFTDPWTAAETIVIQHGFARHHAFWYHWVPILAAKYRVVRRDARGHGLSSSPDSDYNLDDIVGEIVDTLDQLNLKKVHFLGESTSGMLGEVLAAKHPERLQSLIICSSPSHLPQSALDLFAFGYESWPIACLSLGSKGWAEALSKVPGTVSGGDNQDYVRWWITQIARSKKEGLAGYAKFLSTLDARPFLSRINVKTLILAPANSAATSLEEQRWIQSQITGSELVVIDAPGHEIYSQAPEKCQRALLKFLDTLKVS